MIDMNIEKAFYSINDVVLENFSLNANSGDRFCLKGHSGAGKTTILKIIAGIHKGYTGHLEIEDDAHIAYVSQTTGLLPWKRVYKNIVLLKRGKKGNADATKLIDNLGLSGLERRFPMQLSGGQCQRVALAQALFFEPAILLLDESFSALDDDTKLNTLKILDDYLKQSNAVLILVSHTDIESKYLNCKIIEVGK